MSRMAKETRSRRPRRRFDDDFKAQAVRLVLDEGKTVGSVARDLDLTETALREWVKRARADRTHGKTGLTTAEREELTRLRKENRILREEREILRKAAAFFANERRWNSGSSPQRRGTMRSACCAAVCGSRAAASMRGTDGLNRRGPNATASWKSLFLRSLPRVKGATGARG